MVLMHEEDVPPDGCGLLMRRLVLAYLREEGTAAVRSGRPGRAEGYLQRALALDEGNPDLWVLLASAVSGDQARAACARQALALDRGHVRARELLTTASAPLEPEAQLRLPRPCLRPAGRAEARRESAGVGAPLASSRPRQISTAGPRFSPHFFARLLAGWVLLVVVALDLLVGHLYVRKYAGRIYPAVRVAGLQVGGLSFSEVQDLLQQQVAPTLNQEVQLRFAGQTWSYRAAEVGLHYQVEEAGRAAWSAGRSPAGWLEWLRVVLWGQEVPLRAEVRAERLQAVLDRLAAALDRPAVPPRVAWQDGEWQIAPGQDGRHVVREEMEQRLMAALAGIVHGEGPPPTTPVVVAVAVVTDTAALSEAEVAYLRQELERAGRPLTLTCAGLSWPLGPEELAGWLGVGLPPSAPPEVQVDPQAMRDYLAGLAPAASLPVVTPRLEFVGDRVVAFQEGTDGRELDLATSLSRLEETFRRRLAGEAVETVELATAVVPAGSDALLAELGVRELVGEGTSTFVGSSAERVHNIVLGGQELHGRLIAPGEVFSLNDALRPVSWEKGYRTAPIISGGYLVMGLGGGLCQVATTLYRAALNSGLEIVERHPHLWRVEYYEQDAPPGFDATISDGGPDLRFRNNTGHYLLIQVETKVEEWRQTIRFYGTSPGWTVTIDRLEIDASGRQVSYRRTVSRGEEVIIQETIFSRYQ